MKKPRKSSKGSACPKCGARDWKLIMKCGFILHAECQVCGYRDEVMGCVSKGKVIA